MPFSGIFYWKRQLPDHPGAFWWWFWCHLILSRPKTHIAVGFYVDYEDFWMAFLTAISKMWLRWIFLALVIQNGTYLIVRVRFYDAFDVIWSRVDAEWSLRSIFMWILWFFVYLKITVNIFKYHAFAIKTRPALQFHTPLSSRTIIMMILMWFHPGYTQNTHFDRFLCGFYEF